MKQRIVLGVFAVVIVAQLLVPVSMIFSRELTLRHGRQFRFRTAPVDPYDPFRGRYVTLQLEARTVAVPPEASFTRGQTVYAHLTEDESGFASIAQLTSTRPAGDTFVRTRVQRAYHGQVHLDLPFTRYYVDEHVAPAAERAYWRQARRQKRDAYITVRVRAGKAVLEELYIAGLPILEFVNKDAAQRK